MTEQRQHRPRFVRKAIERQKKLGTDAMKPTLADLVSLLQIEKELDADELREVRVRWVESDKTKSFTGV